MQTYDDIAEWYDQWVGTHSMSDDPYFAMVETFMGQVKGVRICDLACGQGRIARHLADRGAQVVGVDLSTKLLTIARRLEEAEPRGITYVHADARDLDEQSLGVFDGVVCFMALMDIPDLAPTLQSVARILRPGGWFIFAILHPCFHTAESGEIETPYGVVRSIRRYFAEGHWQSDTRLGPPGKVGAYHRTLSTYVNALTDAKLQLVYLSEPGGVAITPDASTVASPSLARLGRPVWEEVPSILVAKCSKSSEAR